MDQSHCPKIGYSPGGLGGKEHDSLTKQSEEKESPNQEKVTLVLFYVATDFTFKMAAAMNSTIMLSVSVLLFVLDCICGAKCTEKSILSISHHFIYRIDVFVLEEEKLGS